MKFPNCIEKKISQIYNNYGNETGKMLLHTGAIGWALSSLAQITAIIQNDKISSNQKKFLIPQEFADAATNILAFYSITAFSRKFGKKLVSTGKILPKTVRTFLNEKNVKNVGNYDFDVKNINNLTLPKNIEKSYNKFQNGMDILATTVGSVISCNLVTPIVRNIYASKRQKEMMDTKPILAEKNTAVNPTQNSVARPYSMDGFKNLSSGLKI